MIKVTACDGLDKEAVEILKSNPIIQLDVQNGIAPEKLAVALHESDVVILRSATRLTAPLMRELPKLKAILRAGVGVDNIDLKAAAELGVWVWNAPTGNYQSAAEIAVGLIFAVARKLVVSTEAARQGKWIKKELGSSGRQLSGLTLGVYGGGGHIGIRVAHMAAGLGMHVKICDPVYTSGPFDKVDFDHMLAECDVITIHAPLLDATKHIFNMEAFRKMKRSAILVNAARGGIVKDADLLQALEENLIEGVGLDVFEKEPVPADDALYQKLLKDPRVVSSPHMGASTREATRAVGLESAEKITFMAQLFADPGQVVPKILEKPLNRPAKPRVALRL